MFNCAVEDKEGNEDVCYEVFIIIEYIHSNIYTVTQYIHSNNNQT